MSFDVGGSRIDERLQRINVLPDEKRARKVGCNRSSRSKAIRDLDSMQYGCREKYRRRSCCHRYVAK
ncbi:hypothetical protein SERLA73DRAFT_177741 [Serpula lacrymans var. lacrymans S7.3]|uniref:Uncharacterized protein n=2 Tax=Serpula lacrymans var. lacrymans TaxID=341189 RepID=F8PPF8_SERL3|nr:uncharacterized protein SERLADRAFT_461499 [Serpula lacrymans var. lacrymans S7.9]EGO02035.1 hypothetical protein SERLA73DRAFT_177741 [Serpula lacrymans var. lacrymans S7.3]EGO27658.1 hypothetical protein SERLADRAFT_461499 [Serpula lacrymans var. lacrymans S7.9]